jgi:hypothetical protein
VSPVDAETMRATARRRFRRDRDRYLRSGRAAPPAVVATIRIRRFFRHIAATKRMKLFRNGAEWSAMKLSQIVSLKQENPFGG